MKQYLDRAPNEIERTQAGAPKIKRTRKSSTTNAVSPEIRAAIDDAVKRLYVEPNAESFSVNSFCRRYGIGRQLAYDEINAGHLIARKRGRRTLIWRADADAWLATAPIIQPRAAGEIADC
jgi:hypothetical protein